MYIPKHFSSEDMPLIYELIKEIRFGMIISTDQSKPVVSHIPIDLINEKDGSKYLWGHLAKANGQWQTFKDKEVLIVFTTPAAYISPSWYSAINVPTANYIAIHIYGKVSLIKDKNELVRLLSHSTQIREGDLDREEYKVSDLPKKYLESQLNGLVGFKFSIDKIEPNFKLSQNRNAKDYKNIVSKLNDNASPNNVLIAKMMDRIKNRSDPSNRESDWAFNLAISEKDREDIYDSRYEIAKDSYPFLLNGKSKGHVMMDEFDEASYLFLCRNKAVIGSCRATYFSNDRWEITDSIPDEIILDFNTETTLQLNRVFIHEDYRSKNLHEIMFYEFSKWVLNNTNYTNYFAICNIGLARMYKKLGAELMYSNGFHLKNRLAHKYFLVHGSIEEFSTIISLSINKK